MWICSQGLKRVPPSSGNTQANARGLSLDTAALEGLPGFPKLPLWPPSHCASSLPCFPLGLGLLGTGDSVRLTVPSSVPSPVPDTWKAHKDVQGLKT